MEFTYRGSVCSDLELTKRFIEGILNKLSQSVDNKDTLFDIRIILNELVINGVLHGNDEVPAKCVDLRLEIRDNKLMIEVRDEGDGINYDFKAYNPEELKFNGRGLVLVRGLSDELYIDRNKVIAIKRIS